MLSIKFVHPWGPYVVGDRASFPVERGEALLKSEVAVPDTEAEVEDEEPAPGRKTKR